MIEDWEAVEQSCTVMRHWIVVPVDKEAYPHLDFPWKAYCGRVVDASQAWGQGIQISCPKCQVKADEQGWTDRGLKQWKILRRTGS